MNSEYVNGSAQTIGEAMRHAHEAQLKAQAQARPEVGEPVYGPDLQNYAAKGPESAIHRLQRRQREANAGERKLTRAVDILLRHPEFEELIELLRMDVL